MYKFRAAHANRKRRHCRYGRPKEKYGASLPPSTIIYDHVSERNANWCGGPGIGGGRELKSGPFVS